jgi:thiamine biosynthesis lipoprotein
VVIDRASSTIVVPPGLLLDPGSIGKGLAGDLLVATGRSAGATGVLVNLGGDVRCWGAEATGDPFVVEVAADARLGAPTDADWDAGGPDTGALWVTPGDGAVVTSTVLRRRWATPQGTAHHLVDPDSGRPTTHDVVAVTVVDADGWWADALATAILAAGPAGIKLAIDLELDCRLTFADGTHLPLGRFGRVSTAGAHRLSCASWMPPR